MVSVRSTHHWLQDEARIHAQDTATSLALSAGLFIADQQEPVIESILQAAFDRGYYQKIEFLDPSGTAIVKLEEKAAYPGVPGWFRDWFPMILATANAEVTSKWETKGDINVVVSPDYAYRNLYQQAKDSLLSSFTLFFVALIILYILIRFLLTSLFKLEKQAETIAEGEFVTVQPLPSTREIRQLASTMNAMSSSLEVMTNQLHARIDTLGQELLQDELTGLANKAVFEQHLIELMNANNSFYLFKIKMDCLDQLVKSLERYQLEHCIVVFAGLLKQFCERYASYKASGFRIYGGEFAVVIQHDKKDEIILLARNLSESLKTLERYTHSADITHIGIVSGVVFDTVESLLNAAEEAYAHATLITQNGFYIKHETAKVYDQLTWRKLILSNIQRVHFPLEFIQPMEQLHTGSVVMKEACVQFLDDKNNELPVAVFIAMAEKYPEIVDYEIKVLEHVIQHIQQTQCKYKVVINLSVRTIKNTGFHEVLQKKLSRLPFEAGKLVFSVSAYHAVKELQTLKAFTDVIHELGVQMMLKRFEPATISLQQSTLIKPDYIRLARHITQNIATEKRQQDYIESLAQYSHFQDVRILAEQTTREDSALLSASGVYAASY